MKGFRVTKIVTEINCVKGFRVTKIVTEIKCEGFWGELEAKIFVQYNNPRNL